MSYDAVKIERRAVRPVGSGPFAALDGVLSIAEPLMGVIRGGRLNLVVGERRAWVVSDPVQPDILVTLAPGTCEYFPADHPTRAKRPAFAWEVIRDGIQAGKAIVD